MAGTFTTTVQEHKFPNMGKRARIVRVDWVGDAADGTVPNIPLTLNGYIVKVITIPGSPAPTASYNVKLFDPDAATLDCLINLLAARSATVAEQVYPAPATGQNPILVVSGRDSAGARNYQLNISGNVVNSAKGAVLLYVLEDT